MKRFVQLCLLCCSPLALQAADIASSARSGNFSTTLADGGYFELGASASYLDTNQVRTAGDENGGQLGLAIGGEYRYKGLFVEAALNTSDGLNLGYNFYKNDTWMVDLLASSISGRVNNDDDNPEPPLTTEQRNRAITERDTFYNGAGLRVTAYLPDNDRVYQLRVVTDIHKSNGLTATLRTSKTRQYKNWNFHTIYSVGYNSAKANQYFVGITPEEATMQFPEYRPGASWQLGAEVGATYPVTEHWVFRATLKGWLYPSAVKDSPLIDGSGGVAANVIFSYVF